MSASALSVIKVANELNLLHMSVHATGSTCYSKNMNYLVISRDKIRITLNSR